MTWVKIDDKVRHHPKTTAAGLDVFGLWVAGLSYCNEHVTDGRIPKHALRALFPTEVVPLRTMKRCAAKLVEIGRWHDRADHWEVHGYAVEQSEAMSGAVEERREKEREKKRRQREAKTSGTRDEGEAKTNVTRSEDEREPNDTQETANANLSANDFATKGELSPGDVPVSRARAVPGPDPGPDPDPRELLPHQRTDRYATSDPIAKAIADELARHANVASAIGGEVVHVAEMALGALAKRDPRITAADYALSVREGLAELPEHPTDQAVRSKVRVFVRSTRPGAADGSGNDKSQEQRRRVTTASAPAGLPPAREVTFPKLVEPAPHPLDDILESMPAPEPGTTLGAAKAKATRSA